MVSLYVPCIFYSRRNSVVHDAVLRLNKPKIYTSQTAWNLYKCLKAPLLEFRFEEPRTKKHELFKKVKSFPAVVVVSY